MRFRAIILLATTIIAVKVSFARVSELTNDENASAMINYNENEENDYKLSRSENQVGWDPLPCSKSRKYQECMSIMDRDGNRIYDAYECARKFKCNPYTTLMNDQNVYSSLPGCSKNKKYKECRSKRDEDGVPISDAYMCARKYNCDPYSTLGLDVASEDLPKSFVQSTYKPCKTAELKRKFNDCMKKTMWAICVNTYKCDGTIVKNLRTIQSSICDPVKYEVDFNFCVIERGGFNSVNIADCNNFALSMC
jgi:hypothetical protein